MICPKCGSRIDDNSIFCSICGEKVVVTQNYQQPNQNYQNQYGYQQSQQQYNYQQPQYNYNYQQPQYNGGWVKSTGYIVWSILCILICWPLAIPAIVYATKIDQFNRVGNYYTAKEMAKKSRTFCIIATCVGAALIFLNILVAVLSFINSYYYYY